MISFRARLIHAEHCAATRVRILRFALPEGDTVPAHQPGQYALLEFPGFSPRPYSIANVPNGHLLEFHIRISHSGASAYANKTLKIDDVITIYGFGGNCLFDSDCRSPILLVAGGTGLAPMMAIAETALSADPQRMIALYHGGRHKEDLYADSFLRDLANKFSAFSYYPVLSDEKHDQTLSGLVGDIALGHCCDLDTIRIYAAGPVEMLRRLHSLSEERGIPPERIHSDLQEFDPQPLLSEALR